MNRAQSAVGVGQVVHRRRCPHQIGLTEVGPVSVEIGQHRAHPVNQPERLGPLPQTVEIAGRRVDSGHLRLGKARKQGEGTRPGAPAQIYDLARTRLDGQPAGDGRGVLGKHLGVQFEDLRLAVHVQLMLSTVVGSVRGSVSHAGDARPPVPQRQHASQSAQDGGRMTAGRASHGPAPSRGHLAGRPPCASGRTARGLPPRTCSPPARASPPAASASPTPRWTRRKPLRTATSRACG